jgi:hypothetical protein
VAGSSPSSGFTARVGQKRTFRRSKPFDPQPSCSPFDENVRRAQMRHFLPARRGNCGFANGCATDLQAATSTELRGPLLEAPKTCADSEKRLTDSTVSSGANATNESNASERSQESGVVGEWPRAKFTER